MKEWKGAIKYKFAKIKELPMSSIQEDSVIMPKFDGETTFLFFDSSEKKWTTVNNWGHYRSDYQVTKEAEQSSLDKSKIYVGELIYGMSLYDFLSHKKDSEGLRLVLFEIFEDQNPSSRKEARPDFANRMNSIPLNEIRLEDPSTNYLHLGKVPIFIHLTVKYSSIGSNSDSILKELFERLVKTYEGIVIRGLKNNWVMKVKRKRTLDVVVLGMQKKGKSWDKGEMGSLLVGLYHNNKLLKVGTVGSGFKPRERKAFFKVLMDNKTSEDKYYVYVEPKVVIEIIAYDFVKTVEYDTKVTFRSPIFHRWRFEKPSSDCQHCRKPTMP